MNETNKVQFDPIDDSKVQMEYQKEKNSLVSVILLFIILIGGGIFIYYKMKPIKISDAFDNTLDVSNITYEGKYYMIDDNTTECELCTEKILIDFDKSIYNNEGSFIYFNENKQIAQGAFEDSLFEYYFAPVSFSLIPDYSSYLFRLFDGLKTYNFKKDKDVYTYKMTGKESFDFIDTMPDMYKSDDKTLESTRVEVKLNSSHVDYIKLYYNVNDKEEYTYMKFTMMNETDLGLSSEIEKKAYESYIHFVKPYDGDGLIEPEKYTYTNNKCDKDSDTKKVELSFTRYYEMYSTKAYVTYCSGDTKEIDYYVKNISGNTSDNHDNDIYELINREDDKVLGRFQYDTKKGTITVYNSDMLNGTYKK